MAKESVEMLLQEGLGCYIASTHAVRGPLIAYSDFVRCDLSLADLSLLPEIF